VHATQAGIIDQKAITGFEVFRPVGGDRSRHDIRRRAQMRRLCEGLGKSAQLTIESRKHAQSSALITPLFQ
jgi:hypothetical protein